MLSFRTYFKFCLEGIKCRLLWALDFSVGPLSNEARQGALTVTALAMRSLPLRYLPVRRTCIPPTTFKGVWSIVSITPTCRSLVLPYLLGLTVSKVEQSFSCRYAVKRSWTLCSQCLAFAHSSAPFEDLIFLEHVTNIQHKPRKQTSLHFISG